MKNGIIPEKECTPADNCTALKITTSLYYTPNNHSVQGKGITPDTEYRGENVLKGLIVRESEMKGMIQDKNKDSNPHKTSATCAPTPEALTTKFEKALTGPDGKVDGMLLCAIAHLDKKSKYGEYTVTAPYKADVQVLSQ